MIAKSYNYNQENLQNLFTQTIKNISLMTNFWSSKARHGYLGITITWITPTFEIKDIMLENKYVPSPHTSRAISEELHKFIEAWNFGDHIISITTNNKCNMLAIGKRLALAEILVACTKRLIQFFQYQKQIKQLKKMQKNLGYSDILRCIQYLQTNLYTSQDQEIKKDDATQEFLGNIYVTLSKVIPTIKEMIFDLACETPPNNDLFLDKAIIFESDNKDMQPIDFDDDEIINMTGILEQIKRNIYDALINYWNDSNNLGLMAALLDLRNKSLDFLEDDSEKQLTIQRLYDKFNELEEPMSELSIHLTPFNTKSAM
ncbi:5311_t:CDS:2 [Cetraspora pellucida]|uniref:5311_t:CDS:1 n=1 Tax=Cetraspora pellucida TaxID=1433469 RepID=A0ACA9LDJ0_9GLOM|nr:5311_t:CDS:2 [Cetraspora pellucida]